MNRTNFRPRQLDYSKPIQLVSDINEVFKKDDLLSLTWSIGNSFDEKKTPSEIEIKRVMDLFDKKKTIVIPKVEKLDKGPNVVSATGEGNFSIDPNYKQKLYERPKHCIVYSHKSVLEPNGKDYEATIHDMNFLKYEHSITIEELEKVISELENDINKGEMIPQERIREIILRIIPEKKGFVDKLAKYWLTRRDVFKKSLVRKFWKDQKYTDKYLDTTFRRREKERMKTRRNKKNDLECFQKLKDIRDTSQKQLINIMVNVKEREMYKKTSLILQKYEFEAEINQSKQFEDRWREFNKCIPKPPKNLNLVSQSPEKENIPHRIHYHNNRISKENHIVKKESIVKENTIQLHLAEPSASSLTHQDIHHTKRKVRIRRPEGEKKALHHAKQATEGDIDQSKACVLKTRIRMNRIGHIVIDRYIESHKSLSPFGDNFNEIINKQKVYNEDFVIHTKKSQNFDRMYEDFIKGKYSGLDILTDTEDEIIFAHQVKTISGGFKQFLKQKRAVDT